MVWKLDFPQVEVQPKKRKEDVAQTNVRITYNFSWTF